jgi:hypothetical protein
MSIVRGAPLRGASWFRGVLLGGDRAAHMLALQLFT